MLCSLMLTDLFYQMSFTFHKCFHQHIDLGVINPTTKTVKTSQTKGVHFRLTPGGIHGVVAIGLRDLVTKLETPQFM